MAYDLVIKNGRLITAAATYNADVAINDQHIAALGDNLSGRREIDASGLYVLPGAIDGHVHLTDSASASPLTADSFASGSHAAAFGGVTTLIDFAESRRGETLLESVERRQEDADGQTAIDYSLHLILRDPDPARLAEMPAVFERGVSSLKLFMTYEGYRLPDIAIFRAMEIVAEHDALAIVHAENDEVIQELQRRLEAEGKIGPRWHAATSPSVTESEAIHRALALAQLSGARVLIYHVSSAGGVRELKLAKQQGQPVYGEACIHYLVLTDEAYQSDDLYAQSLMVRPPLRDATHQDRLWQGLAEGVLDIVSTDHNPRPRQTDYHHPGIAGIETRLALVHNFGVRTGRLSLCRWVEVCCTRPAHLFGLARKGYLAPGYDADVVLFDPNKVVTFSPTTLHSAIDYSSYDGISVTGFPVMAINRGQVLVENGEFVGQPGHGRFVRRK